MNKTVLFLLIAFSSLYFSACSLLPNRNQSSQNPSPSPQANPTQNPATSPSYNSTEFAAINTKYGQIVIKLYKSEAPKTVENFLSKANSGFYNNLTFHRVEPGFVVQGGDPAGNGTGGGTITSEINSIPFKRGSIGLARGQEITVSNDSQFFICLTDAQCQSLTNKYVNFGEVVSGMDLVDKIKVADKILTISSKTK